MKKAFIGLLILILSAWAQYVFSAEPIQLARMNGYVAAGVGAGCNETVKDSLSGNATGATVAYSSTYYGKAYSFTASSSYTATKFTVRLAKLGSPTMDYKGYICTSAENKPNVCTASDGTYNAGSLSTTYADIEFTIAAGVEITNGTEYFIAIIPVSLGNGDSSNYIMYRSTGSGTEGNDCANCNSSLSWYNSDTSSDGYLSVISCE